MKHETFHDRRPALEHAALMDAAKQHALELRAEAIDAFWSDVARSLRDAWRLLRRMGTPRGPAPGVSPCPR
ncbi:MAG: hypothetical protein Q8R33_08655 [Burkholderiales bacterium]|nr:hypothetical protein [Burkholderiales bacterium]